MVIRFFFAKFVLTQKGRHPMVIFQLDVEHNSPNKLLQKSMDEKSAPSVIQARVVSLISHKLALAAVRD
jgi:hypothetical protein